MARNLQKFDNMSEVNVWLDTVWKILDSSAYKDSGDPMLGAPESDDMQDAINMADTLIIHLRKRGGELFAKLEAENIEKERLLNGDLDSADEVPVTGESDSGKDAKDD
ncbi:MAG TPA: hypothetical protein DCY51_08325 [Bacteroidetes bacterium]|nr:hypothetical protein [Bacteroidota bacterium]